MEHALKRRNAAILSCLCSAFAAGSAFVPSLPSQQLALISQTYTSTKPCLRGKLHSPAQGAFRGRALFLGTLRLSHSSSAADEDTVESFHPIPIMHPTAEATEAFKVVPPDATMDSERDIIFKPGYGWGDGQHPSTYMCLQFVWEQVSARQEPTFLDYGTGSGVLAVCGKKCGASRVVGVDTDPDILEHAEETARLNNMNDIEFLDGREIVPGWDGLYISDGLSASTFDIVVANMLPPTLCKLAHMISAAVAEETGILALSGMRHEQVDSVKQEFRKHGIHITADRRREGASPGAKWTEYVLLIGRRPKKSEEEQRAYAELLSASTVE